VEGRFKVINLGSHLRFNEWNKSNNLVKFNNIEFISLSDVR
jgi:hypothetical protein